MLIDFCSDSDEKHLLASVRGLQKCIEHPWASGKCWVLVQSYWISTRQKRICNGTHPALCSSVYATWMIYKISDVLANHAAGSQWAEGLKPDFHKVLMILNPKWHRICLNILSDSLVACEKDSNMKTHACWMLWMLNLFNEMCASTIINRSTGSGNVAKRKLTWKSGVRNALRLPESLSLTHKRDSLASVSRAINSADTTSFPLRFPPHLYLLDSPF